MFIEICKQNKFTTPERSHVYRNTDITELQEGSKLICCLRSFFNSKYFADQKKHLFFASAF